MKEGSFHFIHPPDANAFMADKVNTNPAITAASLNDVRVVLPKVYEWLHSNEVYRWVKSHHDASQHIAAEQWREEVLIPQADYLHAMEMAIKKVYGPDWNDDARLSPIDLQWTLWVLPKSAYLVPHMHPACELVCPLVGTIWDCCWTGPTYALREDKWGIGYPAGEGPTMGEFMKLVNTHPENEFWVNRLQTRSITFNPVGSMHQSYTHGSEETLILACWGGKLAFIQDPDPSVRLPTPNVKLGRSPKRGQLSILGRRVYDLRDGTDVTPSVPQLTMHDLQQTWQ